MKIRIDKKKLYAMAHKLNMRLGADFIDEKNQKGVREVGNWFSAFKEMDGVVLVVSNYEIDLDKWLTRNNIDDCKFVEVIELFSEIEDVDDVEYKTPSYIIMRYRVGENGIPEFISETSRISLDSIPKIIGANNMLSISKTIAELFFMIGSGFTFINECEEEDKCDEIIAKDSPFDSLFDKQMVVVNVYWKYDDLKFITKYISAKIAGLRVGENAMMLSDMKERYEEINKIISVNHKGDTLEDDIVNIETRQYCSKFSDFFVIEWKIVCYHSDNQISEHSVFVRVDLNEGLDVDNILEYIGFNGLEKTAYDGISYPEIYKPRNKVKFDPNANVDEDCDFISKKIGDHYADVTYMGYDGECESMNWYKGGILDTKSASFQEVNLGFRQRKKELSEKCEHGHMYLKYQVTDYGYTDAKQMCIGLQGRRKYMIVRFMILDKSDSQIIGSYYFSIEWPFSFNGRETISFYEAIDYLCVDDVSKKEHKNIECEAEDTKNTKEERAEEKNNSTDAMKMLMHDVTSSALVTGEAKHNNIDSIKMLVRDLTGVELVVEFAPGEEVSIDKVKEKLDKQWHGFPHSEPVYFQFL